MKGNLTLTSSDCQTRCGDTLLQMLWPPEFEQEPLLKDTPEIMTHYVSVAITDPGSLFQYTAGAIKHVGYNSKEVCTIATGIWECIVCYIIYLLAFQKDIACTVH